MSLCRLLFLLALLWVAFQLTSLWSFISSLTYMHREHRAPREESLTRWLGLSSRCLRVTWALAEERDSETASRIISEAKARGESMDCATAAGYGPLQYVAWHMGDCGLAEQLIDAGADINRAMKENGYSPLALASGEGHIELVKLLIKEGADIDGQSQRLYPFYHGWGSIRLWDTPSEADMDMCSDCPPPQRHPQASPLVAAIVSGREGALRKARV